MSPPLAGRDTTLSQLAARQSRELARVADEIEQALDVAVLRGLREGKESPALDDLFSLCDGLPLRGSLRRLTATCGSAPRPGFPCLWRGV